MPSGQLSAKVLTAAQRDARDAFLEESKNLERYWRSRFGRYWRSRLADADEDYGEAYIAAVVAGRNTLSANSVKIDEDAVDWDGEEFLIDVRLV
ncbi:MAG: hypothetical protein ACYSVY_21770 [Planctomycetota bacterium]|jgi:hypothetical protein